MPSTKKEWLDLISKYQYIASYIVISLVGLVVAAITIASGWAIIELYLKWIAVAIVFVLFVWAIGELLRIATEVIIRELLRIATEVIKGDLE